MTATKDRITAAKDLDCQLVNSSIPKPIANQGWIRTIRNALGMTADDLALRLGVSGTAVRLLEKSETNSTIQLDSLQRVANALDCDVVVSLQPRIPLSDMVQQQARMRAHEIAQRVSVTMALEDQAVNSDFIHSKIESIYEELLNSRGLWHEIVDAKTDLL
jgi:predicted DNA-binding mobile mystery protein A